MGNTIDIFRVRAHENQAEFDQLRSACQAELSPNTGHDSFPTSPSLAQARSSETIAQPLTGEFDETDPDACIVARLSEREDVFCFQRQATSGETFNQARARPLGPICTNYEKKPMLPTPISLAPLRATPTPTPYTI